MSGTFGISGGGRDAEALFRELTGAAPTDRAALGDAILDGHAVEVKRATSPTLNQIRAVKYLPIAVHHVPTDDWYVIPAHVVVVAVSKKQRGQHTENPFESATLSLNHLAEWKVPDVAQLRAATIGAIEASAQFPRLHNEMQDILRRSRELADESLTRVHSLLATLGL